MDQSQNNILGLLLQLGAHPQRAQSALKIMEASSAALEKDSKVMSEHTAEVLKSSKAQQDAVGGIFPPAHAKPDGCGAAPPDAPSVPGARTGNHHHHRPNGPARQCGGALNPRAALAVGGRRGTGGQGPGRISGGPEGSGGCGGCGRTARGVALLAEGTWPPNPAAIVAAGLHFEAAAQYALLAGTGSHRHSASSSGYGARDAGHGTAGFGNGDSGFGSQTLAPGAGGASSRFSGSGVVIIRGTQDFENYVAGAVNGAVARGVNVTATSAQRGSPVGHQRPGHGLRDKGHGKGN